MPIPDPFAIGQIIDDRWRVDKFRGQSTAFTWQYHVRDVKTNEAAFCTVGPKDEPNGFPDLEEIKLMLKLNAMILKELDMHGSPVPRFINYGEYGQFNYVCTEMVGPDLNWIRQNANAATDLFSLATALNLGLDMLVAIREVHERGYLIRHICPEIFVLPRDSSRSPGLLFVPDAFMLARRYIKLDGTSSVPLRPYADFRGNIRFASIFALRNFDQTRMDDIWQWYYIVVSFVKGNLGWTVTPEMAWMHPANYRAAAATIKEDMHNRPLEWLGAIPTELSVILEYLKTTPRETPPDYSRLFQLVKNARVRVIEESGAAAPPLDWELGGKWYEVLAPLMKLD